MDGTDERTGGGRILWNFLMSLDGFVAGPDHDMSWMTGSTVGPGVIDGYIEATGAILAGRDGFDSAIGDSRPWGGRWQGPIFVLTHHPEDAPPTPDITFLSCGVDEAARIALEAADGRDLMVFSPTIGAQLLAPRADRRDRHPRCAGPPRPGHPALRQPRQRADPPPTTRRR